MDRHWGRHALVICLLLAPAPLLAATWTVESDGTGQFMTIQEAIDNASFGDLVLVGPGTYRDLHADSHGVPVIAELRSGVIVRSRQGSQQTVLDATGVGERRAVSAYDVDAAAALIGFTIHGGDHAIGGGILLSRSSPRVANNEITGNLAGAGAGVVCDGPGRARIEDNEIVQNTACCGDGGGILISAGSSPQVLRNEIAENSGYSGGGIALNQAASPTLQGNHIHDNTSLSGGGIGCNASGGWIVGNRIIRNVADRGGGLTAWSSSRAIFSGNVVAGNTAVGEGGGGYHISGGSPKISHETIVSNSSYIGAGIFGWNGGAPQIENCIIAFGIAGEGIYSDDPQSIPDVSCSDLYGNEYGQYGGFLSDQTGMNGNVSVDPAFCDAGNEDYHLRQESNLRAPGLSNACSLPGALTGLCGTSREVREAPVAITVPGLESDANGIPTHLRMPSARAGKARVLVVDVAGRSVRTLSMAPEGAFPVWDGKDDVGRRLPRGIYFMIEEGSGRTSRRLLLD